MSCYLMAWPILDPDRTRNTLIAEAEPLLSDALIDADLTPVGPTDWQVCEDWTLPDAVDGLALVARVEVASAVVLAPPVEQVTRDERIARVAELTDAGLSVRDIAVRLRITKRTVERDRRDRHRLADNHHDYSQEVSR